MPMLLILCRRFRVGHNVSPRISRVLSLISIVNVGTTKHAIKLMVLPSSLFSLRGIRRDLTFYTEWHDSL